MIIQHNIWFAAAKAAFARPSPWTNKKEALSVVWQQETSSSAEHWREQLFQAPNSKVKTLESKDALLIE